MRETTAEWVEKAEADYKTAQREQDVTDNPNHDGICFHAQQCAEKYLKARLIDASIHFPKTHNLGALLTLLKPVDHDWEHLRERLNSLNALAVEVRYPGYVADADAARGALEIAGNIRRLVRDALGLPS
jgi:HEPN domain-containing protein